MVYVERGSGPPMWEGGVVYVGRGVVYVKRERVVYLERLVSRIQVVIS